ncbi:DNA alkylation repair protein [Pseudoduganella sp. UC29_106]|uniref:DNA alkylation repair protein n=1 Tax=Pseudoduganella sp. UC29_106 TaxID=3374553 RepID=UPI003756BC38
MRNDTLAEVIAALAPHADSERAVAMRAYMRGQFDFLGIPTPQRRAALKPVLAPLRGADANELLALAEALWLQPQREYQYAALDLLAARWKTLQAAELPSLVALARQKSWWDTVDGVAAIVGDVLRGTHVGMDQALADSDFWVRRIALLHQLGWRDAVDAPRLFRYALALSHEKEFFIQKAIGWALRDYARHAPATVQEFLNEHRARLAPLSYREAARHL